MKRILPLILVLLLLCGCAAAEPVLNTLPPATTEAPEPSEPFGYYLEGSKVERLTGGAVRVYPLDASICFGILPMGEDLLLLAGSDRAEPGTFPVTLQRLSGDNLHVAASLDIVDMDYPAISLFQVGDPGVSYYNEERGELVLLDPNLKEVRRLPSPEALTGVPKLSRDWKTLYYGTGEAIMAMDMETGLSRVLKQSPELRKSIDALLLDDTVIQCSVTDGEEVRTLFLSAENGMTLHTQSGYASVETWGDRYYTSFSDGVASANLFGTAGEDPKALNPTNYKSAVYLLPQAHGALSYLWDSPTEQVEMQYYDLASGRRTASLTLPDGSYPWYITAAGPEKVYMLLFDTTYNSETIYCWNTTKSPVSDSLKYVGPFHTLDHPDYTGLEECQALADRVGQDHGLEILLWQDAVAFQPWDYRLEPEYMVPVLRQELTEMDGWLDYYPKGMLETIAQHFGSLRLCLVRQIAGSPLSGSLDLANGLQYWDDAHPYLAITVGVETESTLYHELFHIMDSYILINSSAYDNWDRLNPQGFQYDNDYVKNTQRDGSEYLRPETRSFIDAYSMSFDTEDRARIMEYAMTPCNEELFTSPAMQAKLRQLSIGIRDAFGLKKSPEVFRWEQYLQEPLAWTE